MIIRDRYLQKRICGYHVDVGNVTARRKNADGSSSQKNLEADFTARRGSGQYYIQSAFRMDSEEKEKQELRPLLTIKDSFRKPVVSPSYGKSWYDNDGILHMGRMDFLPDEDSMDR